MSTPALSKPDLMRLVPTSAKSIQRLHLEPTGSHQGMLDGAWWPRSRRPAAELPGLILRIDAVRGQVLSLALAATGWDERPRRLTVGGRTITLDYYGSQPATLLTAICVRSRVDLLVISPTSGQQAAHVAMNHTITTGNRVTVTHPAMTPAANHAAGEDDGGAIPRDLRLGLLDSGRVAVAAASQGRSR